MKASEALVLGSLSTQQGFGSFSPASSTPCALGTIAHALGLAFDNNNVYSQIGKMFPWMLEDQHDLRCPHCSCREYAIMSCVWHLNDQHKWTRPRIAEWLKQFEQVDEVPITQEVMEEAHVTQ